LAGEAARYDVNTPAPRLSVKTSHVTPNGERREKSVVLPLRENGCGVGITLNGAHSPPAEEDAAEDSAAASGEQGEFP